MNLAYWMCQILGWGSYTAIGVTIALREGGPLASVLIGFAAFFCYSIGLTHLLRREIRRRQWLSLPFRQSIPRLIGASIATGLAISALVVIINIAIERNLDWGRQAAFAVASSVTTFTIGWTILYVAITSTRNLLRGQLALRQAELRALENQVNPHFLFNCLNTLRGMIAENPDQARDMVTRLANILRYNLRQDRTPTIPLSEELEVVSDYLALESIRFEDRLRVHFEIDPGAARVPVPSMLLQTLVENALKHGLARLPEGGDLRIHASADSNTLSLRVENTGSLATPDSGSTGVGLKNARDRLRLLYGDRATLTLENGANRVIAAVRIPRTT
jgi:two-component system LytT family sensor kinase